MDEYRRLKQRILVVSYTIEEKKKQLLRPIAAGTLPCCSITQ